MNKGDVKKNKKEKQWAMVVAQLADRSFPIPELPYCELFKRWKWARKETRNGPFLKTTTKRKIGLERVIARVPIPSYHLCSISWPLPEPIWPPKTFQLWRHFFSSVTLMSSCQSFLVRCTFTIDPVCLTISSTEAF